MQAGDASHTREFGPSGTAIRGSTKPFEEDSTHLLLHQLVEIGRTFDSCEARIWGFGFNPLKIPMMFVGKESSSDARFGICCGPVDRAQLELISGGAWGEVAETRPHARRKDDVPFEDFGFLWVNEAIARVFEPRGGDEVSFDADLGDRESLVIDYAGQNYKPDSWEFARFVVHEAFHHHQLFDAKWKVPYGYDPATPPCTDPDNSRMAKEEARIVEVAVLAENDEAALQLVNRFVDLRTKRFERWPEIEMLERGTEQVEGSARYVENEYSACNGRAGRLNMPPEALRSDQDWLDFGRLYRSGARMLELLDRFAIPWRTRLTEGDDPYLILRETLV